MLEPTVVPLDKFKPRPYQIPLIRALEVDGYKRMLSIMPRRAGKDLTAWNMMIRQALQRIGVYWYILPSYAMGKKIIWNGKDNQGNDFLSYIPSELIKSTNSQEMIIKLVNGSLIQIVGSDSAKDSLIGTNAIGMIFSEYALQDPTGYQYLRPILLQNEGWSIFLSTPRGRNHLYDLYELGLANPEEWFVQKLTIDDTKHVSLEEIQKDIDSGEVSYEMVQQEWFTSFDLGIHGAYYTKYLDDMKRNNQIDNIPWDPSFKVHTNWDIGMRDQTAIVMWQLRNDNLYVIDTYEHSDVGLEHYIKILEGKPYRWGTHFGPHDIQVRELGTGMSRLERARQLGIEFQIAPNLSIADGIEAVRATLPKTYIDKTKCAPLIKALENYRKIFDPRTNSYREKPLHDQFSHFCDAFRYTSLSYKKVTNGMSPEDLEKRYRASLLTPRSDGPMSRSAGWF